MNEGGLSSACERAEEWKRDVGARLVRLEKQMKSSQLDRVRLFYSPLALLDATLALVSRMEMVKEKKNAVRFADGILEQVRDGAAIYSRWTMPSRGFEPRF